MDENRSAFPCPTCRLGLLVIELPDDRVPRGAVLACPHCQGVWVRGASIRALVAKVAELLQAPAEPSDSRVSAAVPRMCPRCRIRMDIVGCRNRHGSLLLDRCQSCHGLWFDRGELVAYKTMLHSAEPRHQRYIHKEPRLEDDYGPDPDARPAELPPTALLDVIVALLPGIDS